MREGHCDWEPRRQCVSMNGMPRPPRIQYPGAHYHVWDRGNRRAEIFLDDNDRRLFLWLLGAVCEQHHWRCLSYCLMGNHYHLIVRTDQPTLSAGMHQLKTCYAQAFNTMHDLTGHVFQSRFRAKRIEDDRYLMQLFRYVAMNPVGANLCSAPEQWPWSSHQVIIGMRTHRRWFDRECVLSFFANDTERYRTFISEPSNGVPGTRVSRVLDAHASGMTVSAIARTLGCSRSTVLRALHAHQKVPGTS